MSTEAPHKPQVPRPAAAAATENEGEECGGRYRDGVEVGLKWNDNDDDNGSVMEGRHFYVKSCSRINCIKKCNKFRSRQQMGHCSSSSFVNKWPIFIMPISFSHAA